MSRAEDPNQDQPETCLKEDGNANTSKPERENSARGKHLLQPSPRKKRPVSPLALIKEDFSQLKEDVLKVFKEGRTEPGGQADNNLISTTIDLIKEDLNHFKEDVASVFSASSSKDKEAKATEKTMNRLSSFKDDLSNIFRISQSKDRDTAKEDSSDTPQVKVSMAEWEEEPVERLLNRDLMTSQKANNSQGLKKTSEEQTDNGFSRNLSEQNNNTMKQQMEEWEENDMSLSEAPHFKVEDLTPQADLNQVKDLSSLPVWSASSCPTTLACSKTTETTASQPLVTEHPHHLSPSLNPLAGRGDAEEGGQDEKEDEEEKQDVKEEEEEEEKKEEEEEEPSETLSSAIDLISLRDNNIMRDHSVGDLWSVKNFACYLTFDPNTANSELWLSDGNRAAARRWPGLRSAEHPERFQRCPQVLCREGLLDSNYWEVTWSGGADVGVTYNSISRDGDASSCLLGHNTVSWGLECSEGSYTPCHAGRRLRARCPLPFTRTVGLHLDWSAGTLSFYCVSEDTMVHLHTFTCTFTEPLYPCFWVWAYDGRVSLCDVALAWERLLQ